MKVKYSDEMKPIYEALLNDNALKDVMPNATGDWETDRNVFTATQEALAIALENPDDIRLEEFHDREVDSLFGIDEEEYFENDIF